MFVHVYIYNVCTSPPAGSMAASAKYVGEMGIRTLSAYMAASPPVGGQLREPSIEYAGTVTVGTLSPLLCLCTTIHIYTYICRHTYIYIYMHTFI